MTLRKKLVLVAIAFGVLCLTSNGRIADATTLVLSGPFVVSDVPELLLCCGEPPTGNLFPSVIGKVSLTYDNTVLAPTFSPAPVISLNLFEISFGNSLTGPKEFGLSDVIALINQGPGFTNFVIQSNNPPAAGQEGFFLEVFSRNDVVLPGPLFEYTQAGNFSTFYVGGSASVADLPTITPLIPEPGTLILLGTGLLALCGSVLLWPDRSTRGDRFKSDPACNSKTDKLIHSLRCNATPDRLAVLMRLHQGKPVLGRLII